MTEGCCTPLATSPLSSDDAGWMASVFKALGDPVRLRILAALAHAESAEICACDLVALAGRSQPTVSHHLKVLREAGLVSGERRGTWIWYSVVPDRLAELRSALDVDAASRV